METNHGCLWISTIKDALRVARNPLITVTIEMVNGVHMTQIVQKAQLIRALILMKSQGETLLLDYDGNPTQWLIRANTPDQLTIC